MSRYNHKTNLYVAHSKAKNQFKREDEQIK